MNYRQLDWAEFDKCVDKLIAKVSKTEFDFVYGHPRGGLIPAVIISHQLHISYLHDLDSVPSGSKVLIVDEICETGKTLIELSEQNKSYEENNEVRYKYAVMFKRSTATFEPDYYAEILKDDTWVVYPFETLETSLETPKSWSH